MSAYRWTEEDLSEFKRNSGRGLPLATLKEMAKGRKAQAQAAAQLVPRAVPRVAKRAKPAPPAVKNPKIAPPVPVPTAAKLHQGGVAFAHQAGHKYHAQATVVDGIRFDSKLESERYKELKLEVAAGTVRYFLRQVPFHLPGGVRYVVDFMIVRPLNCGSADSDINALKWCQVEYEDCKGAQTAEGKNKIKQVFALYGVVVRLVKRAGSPRRRQKSRS